MSAPGRRTVTRTDYHAYIQSPDWRAVRDRYWASRLPKSCAGCARPRHPGMHLHHRTYKNLGCERLMDLVPLCQECHDFVHAYQREVNSNLWGATNVVTRAIARRQKDRIPAQLLDRYTAAVQRRELHGAAIDAQRQARSEKAKGVSAARRKRRRALRAATSEGGSS